MEPLRSTSQCDQSRLQSLSVSGRQRLSSPVQNAYCISSKAVPLAPIGKYGGKVSTTRISDFPLLHVYVGANGATNGGEGTMNGPVHNSIASRIRAKAHDLLSLNPFAPAPAGMIEQTEGEVVLDEIGRNSTIPPTSF